VHVAGGCGWDVVVDDAVDAAEVDAAAEEVGGYQDPNLAGAEVVHYGGALGGGEGGVEEGDARDVGVGVGGWGCGGGDVVLEFGVKGGGAGDGLGED